ncbi:hypothetical protein DFH29DRAFT_998012 [Suillus ampliporus]|nr:hypothetical protein DFH29DRAFT_998012 [Suillus ampliporus]
MSFISDTHEYHADMSPPAQNIACYMYSNHLGTVLPYYGPLLSSSEIMTFVGYTAIGLQPMLYPVYCPVSCLEAVKHHIILSAYLQTACIHISAFKADQSTDVPIYTLVGAPSSAIIDLPPRWTRQGHNTRTHIAPSNSQTVVFWAKHPLGYNAHTLQISEPQDMLEAYSSTSLNDSSLLNSWIMSNLNTISEDNSDVLAHESYGTPNPYSTHSVSHAEDEVCVASNKLHHADAPPASEEDTSTLQGIMMVYPKWRLVLAYLRLLIRVAILRGESGNPHAITRTLATTKNAFISRLYAESLVRANTSVEELEMVVSTKDGRIITEREVLIMAIPWISHLIYDTRRISWEAISHPQTGFGMSGIYSIALKVRLEFLLDHFLPPHSTLLPIDQNGIVWFLRTKFAKALLWHVVFRTTRSNGVRIHSTPTVPLVVTDLAPDAFKNAPNLPINTLAFVESFCYGALVRLLKKVVETLPNAPFIRVYPKEAQIHDQAIETISMLLQQHDDAGLASFQVHMLHLCNLAVDDVERVVRQ